MKIIISESRVNDAIYNFIDSYYDVDMINVESMPNMDHKKENCGLDYYISDEDYDETIFKLYFKDYWIYKNDPKIELSPLLIFEDEEFYENLDNIFGNRWNPVFVQWFKDKFNQDIKTIEPFSSYFRIR